MTTNELKKWAERRASEATDQLEMHDFHETSLSGPLGDVVDALQALAEACEEAE